MKKVRRQIIQDMARPINGADVLYPILLNSDLAETEEFKGSEIEEEMIASIGGQVVIEVCQALLNETRGAKRDPSLREKQSRIAKLLASSLNLRDITGREPVLEGFFKEELIPATELPKASQARIIRQKNTEEFLSRPELYLRGFDQAKDSNKYIQYVKYLLSVLPELIQRDRYKEILEIVTCLVSHLDRKGPLSAHAEQALGIIGNEKVFSVLKAKFMGGQKETCLAVGSIFLKLGKKSLRHLRYSLEKSDDMVVIKTAFEILMQIDPDAINTLFHTTDRKQIPTEKAVRFIRALSEIKGEAWAKPLDQALRAYLRDENPRLREEALMAYYKIAGDGGEKLYLTLLNDPDIGVQKSAIQCLGRIKSHAGLEEFLAMLKELEDAPSHRVRLIEAALLSALGYYGNIERPGEAGSLEEFLLEMLNGQLNLGPLRFLKKKKTTMSRGSVAAICETLGKIGTDKSRDILQKLEKQNEDLWKRKAGEALIRIGEREDRPQAQ
jgi:HEAT repeat protein